MLQSVLLQCSSTPERTDTEHIIPYIQHDKTKEHNHITFQLVFFSFLFSLHWAREHDITGEKQREQVYPSNALMNMQAKISVVNLGLVFLESFIEKKLCKRTQSDIFAGIGTVPYIYIKGIRGLPISHFSLRKMQRIRTKS